MEPITLTFAIIGAAATAVGLMCLVEWLDK